VHLLALKRTYEHTASLLIEHNLFVGAGAVEFILCHAEVEIAFAEEKKIELVWFFTLHPELICLHCLM